MKKIAILIGNDMNDYDIFVPLDIWNKCGYVVNLISFEKKNTVQLESGFKVSCFSTIDKVNLLQYNAIYIPGGSGVKNISYEHWAQKDKLIFKKFVNSLLKIIEDLENQKFLFLTDESICIINQLELLVNFKEKDVFSKTKKEEIKIIQDKILVVKGKIALNDFAIQTAKLLSDNKNKSKIEELEKKLF